MRRISIENCAESVLVVAKPPAMHFGEGSDFKFALSPIVGPNTGQVRFVYRAMVCVLQFFSNSAREYFHSRGSKNFRLRSKFLRNRSFNGSNRKKLRKFRTFYTFLSEKSVHAKPGKLNDFSLALNFAQCGDECPIVTTITAAACRAATLAAACADSATKTNRVSTVSAVSLRLLRR